MNGDQPTKRDPIKRIEAMVVRHQSIPGRFEDLMHHIADKLEIRVGTYEKVSFSSKEFDELLLERAYKVLLKWNALSVSFSAGYSDFRESTPAKLTVRFKDRK